MTDKLITEQKVRLILDKTYIDGVKSGKGGLGYSERAFDQFMELLADERAKVLSEVEELIAQMTKTDAFQEAEREFMLIGWNDAVRELVAKLNQLKGSDVTR